MLCHNCSNRTALPDSNENIKRTFNPDDPGLQKALKDPSVSRVVLLRGLESLGIIREYHIFSNGQKGRSFERITEPCDLHVDMVSRRLLNSKGGSFPLKAPPHRVSTLLILLLHKYPNPVRKYDMVDAIGRPISNDSFRKAFSDLRKIVGEYVLPKESRALNPQSKIIIEKEIK